MRTCASSSTISTLPAESIAWAGLESASIIAGPRARRAPIQTVVSLQDRYKLKRTVSRSTPRSSDARLSFMRQRVTLGTAGIGLAPVIVQEIDSDTQARDSGRG